MKRHAHLDAARFGPWAVVTGASSGIGREFARQLAANGINVVLAARRLAMLEDLGAELSAQYGVRHRALAVDLTQPGFLDRIVEATEDLDVGLLVSNAGTGMPGEFLTHDLEALRWIVRLNCLAHLDLTHHFGQRLARRGRGGVILVSAMGASSGMPYMANDAATKAYVLMLGEGLHYELGRHGVRVSVLLPGPTDTPVLDELGFDPNTSPIKPMSVEQCVREGLSALAANRATRVPGRMNRVLTTVVPRKMTIRLMSRMVGGWVENKAARSAVRS